MADSEEEIKRRILYGDDVDVEEELTPEEFERRMKEREDEEGGKEAQEEPEERNESTMAMIAAAQPISVMKASPWFASPIAATATGFGSSYASSSSAGSQSSSYGRQRDVRLRTNPLPGIPQSQPTNRAVTGGRFNEMPRYYVKWMSAKAKAEANAKREQEEKEREEAIRRRERGEPDPPKAGISETSKEGKRERSPSFGSLSAHRRADWSPTPTPASSIDERHATAEEIAKHTPRSLSLSFDPDSDYSPLSSLNEEGMLALQSQIAVKQRNVPTPEEYKILKGYLYGQLANAAIFGIWWTLFSPLVISLFSSKGVGTTRICYNGALFLISPIAGALAEKSSLKQLLALTASERAIIYALLLPGGWFLFVWYLNHQTIFYALFLVAMIIDGIFVALGNVCAIDCGGLDLLAGQQNIPIDDTIRNHFNSLFQAFFDGSMIVLSPIIAVVSQVVFEHYLTQEEYQSITLIGALGISIGVLSGVCLFFYFLRIPSQPKKDLSDPSDSSSFKKLMNLFYNVYDGFLIFVRNPRLRWRLVFLAIETSFEDAMVVLMIAEYAARVIAPSDPIKANLWTNIIISVSKIGAVLSALMMNRFWRPPAPNDRDGKGFRRLFICTIIAGITAMSIPIANYVEQQGYHQVAMAIVFIGAFFFFFFATIPKIGFATLLQSISAEEDASGRIFGFAATFVTATDAALLMGLSMLFEYVDITTTFWISGGLFVVVSCFEGLFGPRLMKLGGWCVSRRDRETPGGSTIEKQPLLIN